MKIARFTLSWIIICFTSIQAITPRTDALSACYLREVNPKAEKLTLVPIGFTKIRVVAFPVVK